MIYLDNAATTPILPAVLEEMMSYLAGEGGYGNPGSIHTAGRAARSAVETAREQTAELIGAEPEQIIFTSGGSEANNLAIRGTIPYIRAKNRTHIVSTLTEHDSVINTITDLCNADLRLSPSHRLTASFAGVCGRHGSISPDSIRNITSRRTGLVSVMYVNNETGAENNIYEIAENCREKGAIFHTDCTQAVGCHKIDVNKIGCDLMSFSGHKIFAPKGVGALYVRDKSKLTPLITGGSEQEFGYRGGTENVAGIVGLGKACEILGNTNPDTLGRTVFLLKIKFVLALSTKMQQYGLDDVWHINSAPDSKILSLRFDGIDAQTMLLMLDSKGIHVSAGSACRSHETNPSRTLLAQGFSAEEAGSTIRISFSPYQSVSEVTVGADIMVECVKLLHGGM